MARNFSPRKRRNKTVLSPQQSIIRSYFTPRNGITKEDVNFLVKPVKEPKFKRPASEMTRDSNGICGQLDQITFPSFTTAAKVHEQASKWCKSGTIKGEFLSSQPDEESECPWDVHSQTCTDKNSFSDDSAYFSSGRKQTHINSRARVLPLMASSSSSSSSNSSTSSSSRKVKRAQNRQNHRNIKTEKRHKQTTLISLLDSEDGENSSDSDCCIVKHVVRKNKTPLSDSDVEEISSCSQTSYSGSSQSSQTTVKRKTASSSASQTSDSSESSRSSSTKSAEPSKSAKSSRHPKKQSSASSSMYGLVGDDVSESEDDSEDLSHCGTEFSQLPVEIMENIFCQLPIIDLMLNCVLVCRQWNSIISRDSVISMKVKLIIQKPDLGCCYITKTIIFPSNLKYSVATRLASHAVVFRGLVLLPPHKHLLHRAPHSFPLLSQSQRTF